MLNIRNYNNSIILSFGNSKVGQAVQPTSNVHENVPKSEDKTEKKDFNKKNLYIGAAALASIAIAGILIAKASKGKKLSSKDTNLLEMHTPSPSSGAEKMEADESLEKYRFWHAENPKIIGEDIIPYDEKEEMLRMNAENKIRKEISDKFKEFRKDPEHAEGFSQLRIDLVTFFRDMFKPIPADLRPLDEDDYKAVSSFLRKYQYNAKLRAGMDLSDVDEVKRMSRLIEEAEPLDHDVYVYRGIRKNKLWGDFQKLEFIPEEGFEVGDIIKDRAFVSTSRAYDVDIAATDSYNMGKQYQTSGYILRIKLPKGTKGLDCRRCSGKDTDRGINATYILPIGTELRVTGASSPERIIDCEYILPKTT